MTTPDTAPQRGGMVHHYPPVRVVWVQRVDMFACRASGTSSDDLVASLCYEHPSQEMQGLIIGICSSVFINHSGLGPVSIPDAQREAIIHLFREIAVAMRENVRLRDHPRLYNPGHWSLETAQDYRTVQVEVAITVRLPEYHVGSARPPIQLWDAPRTRYLNQYGDDVEDQHGLFSGAFASVVQPAPDAAALIPDIPPPARQTPLPTERRPLRTREDLTGPADSASAAPRATPQITMNRRLIIRKK